MPESVFEIIERSIAGGEFQRLILSQPRHTESRVVKATLTPVVVRREPHLQLALFTSTQVSHENLPPTAAVRRLRELLEETFDQGLLTTRESTCAFHHRKDGSWKVKQTSRELDDSASNDAALPVHNRSKAYLIPENVPCPFLHAAGVMTESGRVKAAMYHKFRQINRYLELVNDTVPVLPSERPVEIVDFGCGKSYLTFALHHLLTVIHSRPTHLVGLDRKSEVVRNCAELARRLNCEGLEFREGDLSEYSPSGPVDLAVSLHACDTATDAALAQAINWDCRAILAVPCCQHELAPLLHSAELQPLLRHGLSRDRFAALSTDSLRAQLLEICGYSTQVVEFIDMEHTAKNVLLRAIRRQQPDPQRSQRIDEYLHFKKSLGVTDWSLEKLLDRRLAGDLS